jgi:hypothetical protein
MGGSNRSKFGEIAHNFHDVTLNFCDNLLIATYRFAQLQRLYSSILEVG